jgi:broad specificity phosphatase PhoE
MSIIRLSFLCALLGFLSVAANSQPAPSQPEWIDALRQGGYVIVFRHAPFSAQVGNDLQKMKKTSAQHQLNDEGRAQAKSIGESMHKLGIPVGQVQTSTLERAVETGTLLGFGEVTGSPDVTESDVAATSAENNRRAEAFRKLVASQPPAGSNLVIVSHKPNIVDAFGKDWSDVRAGEASVFKPDGNGGYKLIVRVQASEWSKLAEASN